LAETPLAYCIVRFAAARFAPHSGVRNGQSRAQSVRQFTHSNFDLAGHCWSTTLLLRGPSQTAVGRLCALLRILALSTCVVIIELRDRDDHLDKALR
jgi:hypothetical protein